MENFKKIQANLVEQLKANNACSDQLKRTIDAQTWSELQDFICDNIWWCIDNDIRIPDSYYKNAKAEFTVVNGKVHGEYIRYWYYGTVYEKCTFNNGQKHGEYVSYYDSGQIDEKRNYENDKVHGQYICFYENGQVHQKFNCVKDKVHGEYIRYYDNGNVQVKCNFLNGEKCGEEIHYYEDGQIKKMISHNKVKGEKKNEMTSHIDNIRAVVLTQLHKDSLIYSYLKNELDKLEILSFKYGNNI
jgi:hypothetical protein